MRIICRLFGHRRSTAEARRYGDVEWRSVCRTCREPLIRLGPGNWVPIRSHRAGDGAAAGDGEQDQNIASSTPPNATL